MYWLEVHSEIRKSQIQVWAQLDEANVLRALWIYLLAGVLKGWKWVGSCQSTKTLLSLVWLAIAWEPYYYGFVYSSNGILCFTYLQHPQSFPCIFRIIYYLSTNKGQWWMVLVLLLWSEFSDSFMLGRYELRKFFLRNIWHIFP